MSIEAAITQLADGIHKMAAALNRIADALTVPTTVDTPAPAPAAPSKPKAEKPKEEAPAPTGSPEKLVYADYIQKPALDLVKAKGRDALADVLKKVGATSAKEVPEARWHELRALIDAELAPTLA